MVLKESNGTEGLELSDYRTFADLNDYCVLKFGSVRQVISKVPKNYPKQTFGRYGPKMR